VHQETYHVTPVFLWQDVADEPEYRHEELREFYLGAASASYYGQRTPSEVVEAKGSILLGFWLVHLRLALTIPLVLLPWVLSDRRFFIPLTSILLVLGASLGTQWLLLHYLAPILPAVLILLVAGFLNIGAWETPGRSGGLLVAVGLSCIFLLSSMTQILSYVREPHHEFAAARTRIAHQLEATPGRHLVVVRYDPGRNLHLEWVYNRAEIDAAKVVWAREMSPEQNSRLLEYYWDRHAWLLEADAEIPDLQRYRR